MIDFNHTKQYTLSIRLSADGFCFSVHNPLVDEQYAYQPYNIDPQKSLAANFKAAMLTTEMLKHTYNNVNIIVADAAYTLVPKEYYDESYKRELYMQNFPQTPGSTVVLHNVVGDEQVVILFGLEHQLHQLFTEHYPKAYICTPASVLTNYGIEKSHATSQRYCLVHLRKRNIDLLCFANGAPLYVNTFNNHNTTDTLYFLLNCWQILGLSQTEDTLHLAGNARNAKEIIKELSKFIQNIHTIHPAEEFHSTELARLGEIPFDLQALIVCE